jgi:hypothetical protein
MTGATAKRKPDGIPSPFSRRQGWATCTLSWSCPVQVFTERAFGIDRLINEGHASGGGRDLLKQFQPFDGHARLMGKREAGPVLHNVQ